MALIVATMGKDLPGLYSTINLVVAGFDASMFWLNGNSFSNLFAWMLFSIDALRFGIAYVLFHGVRKRSMFKCKMFCICEAVLILLAILGLIIRIITVAGVVWFIIVIVLRAYGIRLIGGFIRTLQNDSGQQASFPWTMFAEPVNIQNQIKTAEFPASPV